MTYSAKDLTTEIREILDQAMRGLPTSASFIALEIVERHPFPAGWEGADRDFAKLCVHGHVRNEVHNVLRAMRNQQDEGAGSEQLVMEGFSRLQRVYIIEHDGDYKCCAIDALSDNQLLAKAEEYDAMAHGCAEHANEIRRYVAARGRRAPGRGAALGRSWA